MERMGGVIDSIKELHQIQDLSGELLVLKQKFTAYLNERNIESTKRILIFFNNDSVHSDQVQKSIMLPLLQKLFFRPELR